MRRSPGPNVLPALAALACPRPGLRRTSAPPTGRFGSSPQRRENAQDLRLLARDGDDLLFEVIDGAR
jgi:hypothetical protein